MLGPVDKRLERAHVNRTGFRGAASRSLGGLLMFGSSIGDGVEDTRLSADVTQGNGEGW